MNGLLDRLQQALARQRAFTADASHELRTPLTALKAELQLAASSEPAGPDHDSLQQGDQTSPDTASGTAKAATVKATSPTPEPSSSEGESSTESESTVSDGPGGHADASGNVQYEFNGVQ